MRKITLFWIIVVMAIIAGCQKQVPDFSSDMAIDLIEQQCAIGSRQAGSSELELVRDLIRIELKKTGAMIHEGVFEFQHRDKLVKGINITASFYPRLSKRIMFVTYYDSFIDSEAKSSNYFGANANASSVATLLAIAQIVGKNEPSKYGIDIVFLDACFPCEKEMGSFGTKFFLSDYSGKKPELVLYVDRIAGINQSLEMDSLSYNANPIESRYVWNTAKQLESLIFSSNFYQSNSRDVVLFIKNKMPIVHLSCPSNRDFSENDTMKNVSPKTIESVGKVFMQIIYSKKDIK